MAKLNLRNSVLYAESWNVAWRKKGTGTILADTKTPFNIIKNSYRYWAADPFVIEYNGEVYIFAELYDYVLCRGILGCCKLSENGQSKWIPIIREEFHLSYPCIVERENKIYLLPESGAGDELFLYEAIEFPYKWKKSKILRKHVKFADTTPLHGKEFRIALTHQVADPYHPKLMLIDLDNKIDDMEIECEYLLRSRPAGNTFLYKGKSVRPAQNSLNCNEGYGKSLIFYVYHIDENLCYTESLLMEIQPTELKYSEQICLEGMHTYNSSEHYEVIDIKTRRFNLLNFIFRIWNKIAKRIGVKR